MNRWSLVLLCMLPSCDKQAVTPTPARSVSGAEVTCASTSCDGGDGAPSPVPSAAEDGARAVALSAAPDGLTCSLQVAPSSDNRHSITVALVNKGSAPLTVRYFHPLAFALRAFIDGTEMNVRTPAFDSPVTPRDLELAPGASSQIVTPIAMSFGTGSREFDEKDPHRLWIPHEPARVRLIAERALASHPGLSCQGEWQGR
ncbi:MAG: hypothetical protein R3B13_06915 [Polyangiaceae bacterium]